MRTSTIRLQYDTGKLDAIRCCLKDESELQTELNAWFQALYEKHVPEEVRRDIENREEDVTGDKAW